MASLARFSRLFGPDILNYSKKVTTNVVTKQNTPLAKLWNPQVAGVFTKQPLPKIWIPKTDRVKGLPWFPNFPRHQVEVQDPTEAEEEMVTNMTAAINKQIANKEAGRLFAVVHICGKQFKVTESDVIIIQGFWPPNPGDQLSLDKVMLIGGTDFTLVGRPILDSELVQVNATVVNKTFSHTKTHFKFRPRKQFRRINFRRVQLTTLRINNIEINRDIDKKNEFEGLNRIY